MSKCAFARHKKLYITLIVSAALLLALVVGCAVYLGDYYKADTAAIAAAPFGQGVTELPLEGGELAFLPSGEPVAGLIFYPGGKVEHTAYLPLMRAMAEQGVLCVLVEMPFRLAVLDSNAADGLAACFPQVTDWYVGGHSLGGAMAASYLASNADVYKGLLLLGAYSTSDLADTDLAVLSLWGSDDRILDRPKYHSCKGNLPLDHLTEYEIKGGNHAGFGMYGAQEGDGEGLLSAAEQIALTARLFAQFAAEKNA